MAAQEKLLLESRHQENFFTPKYDYYGYTNCDYGCTICVYLIECQKINCKQKYIWETERNITTRIMEHRGYIINFKHKATGDHFNLPGHSVKDMKYTI